MEFATAEYIVPAVGNQRESATLRGNRRIALNVEGEAEKTFLLTVLVTDPVEVERWSTGAQHSRIKKSSPYSMTRIFVLPLAE